MKASPLAKKIAAERGVGLEGLQGSGPGGRVVSKDIPEKGAAPAAAPAPKVQAAVAGQGDQRIPLTGMRRVIAERLLASKTQLPPLLSFHRGGCERAHAPAQGTQ